MSKGTNEKVVLVVGALGLDRLLSVNTYPVADQKVRTTAYNEYGGGNAGNTSSAMGRLLDSSFLRDQKISIKLLTKIGDDSVGQQLKRELQDSGVDTSSPLFRMGPRGTTTSFTTIIVSEEEHTRTCLHTPGTSGELTLEDLQAVDMDEIFKNVVHLHSDSRHTQASLYLAKEAKSRGIPVSVDIEKDRKTKDVDQLLEISDMIFTNNIYLSAYLDRLENELQLRDKRMPLPHPTVSTTAGTTLDVDTVNLYAASLNPMAFYTRWYSESHKTVVVTQGAAGSLHFHQESSAIEDGAGNQPSSDIQISEDSENTILVQHVYTEVWDGEQARNEVCTRNYKVHQAGILPDLKIIDTTGAGDAFIGGLLMAKVGCSNGYEDTVQLELNFASWVAGKKLEGPGARHSLPRGTDVNELLGMNVSEIRDALTQKLTPFNKS